MRIFCIILGFSIISASCNKYLDAKPSNSYAAPSTVSDCQLLLDDAQKMNMGFIVEGESSADNFYLNPSQIDIWSGKPFLSLYLWDDNVYSASPTSNVWGNLYAAVLNSNVVLETLSSIKRDNNNAKAYDNAKGSALFFRGYTFCKLLSMFAKGYNETTKNTDLGIPLRLSSDFNDVSIRSNVGSSYDQVVSDLKIAARLLSAERPQFTERPSKRAAFGALAEVYLVMHQYQQAKLYADSCLLIAGDLMDYNQFDVTSSTPFPVDNDEVIINVLANRRGFSTGSYSVDTTLYKSYDDMDLRRDLFFRKVNDTTYAFKGSYFQPSYLFTGIATDEIYLIRAECNARAGNLQDAVEDLNTLLAKRYVTGSFTPYEVVGASELLSLILNERRKELVFRDLRWSDIKRLNLDGEVIDITRVINGSPKVLKANDNRFALAIPNREINISGMKQNPR